MPSHPLHFRKRARAPSSERVLGHLLRADAGLEEARDGLLQRRPPEGQQQVRGRGRPGHDRG